MITFIWNYFGVFGTFQANIEKGSPENHASIILDTSATPLHWFFFFHRNFACRSAEYNYVTLQCRLSDFDRRTLAENNVQAVDLVEAQGVDYFENLCLNNDNACEKDRSYQIPKFGVPSQKVSAHIKTHFYVDKELMVSYFLPYV